jgi:hypothetical protein
MNRAYGLVIRLNGAEKLATTQLAQVERLPASTLSPRLSLKDVKRCGLWWPNHSTMKEQA